MEVPFILYSLVLVLAKDLRNLVNTLFNWIPEHSHLNLMNKGKASSFDFLDDGWAFHFSYLLFISLLYEYTDIIEKKVKKFQKNFNFFSPS